MTRIGRAGAVALGTAVLAVIAVAVAVVATGLTRRPEVPPAALDPPRFVEEAIAAGIDHVYDGDWTFFVGGGVAVFDCDDDRRPELYLAGGSRRAALFRNESAVGGPLRFSPVAHPATDLTSVTGAYPLDIDGDGRTDLAVLRVGEDVLLRGLGGCRFERANEAWGFESSDAWTTAFSAAWEGTAVAPTLAFGSYVELTASGTSAGRCTDNVLARPDQSRVRYARPVALAPGRCALSMLFSDWGRSGRRDLRVSNDRHYDPEAEEQLWRIADGETPRLYTREEGWAKVQIWGMGIASHDVTGDGYPEVFLTSQGDNKLQTLADGPARPAYRDIAIRRGVTAHRPFTGGDVMPSTAWHSEFQDVNNDGYMDLFIAKGNVEAMSEYATRDPSNLLLGQADGRFDESAEEAAVVSFARARGAALADLDLDGMLDLVVVNRRESVKLWRSVGWGTSERPAPMGDWIAVRLEQAGPNRDAIGSWLELQVGGRVTHREVTVGGGHAGGQLGWVHLGLGHADEAEIRVRWPDGATGPWMRVPSGRFAIIERGATAPREWALGR